MPNFSGMWTERQQMQAAGASTWPAVPGAPTIGTATAGDTTASVGFTAPSYTGYPTGITSYTVTSSPGGLTGTGASSPITVSGLTNGTAYTFTVTATNATGTGPASAASNSVTPSYTYIEDVFSTYLYTGTGSSQTIVNGIDLSTKGGLAWVKQRDFANGHILVDTVRGGGNYLQTNTTGANEVNATVIPTFTTTGFNTGGAIDSPAKTFASWTFREQPKFFDVVTYTGNDTTQNIAHSLGSTPGCVIIKRTDGAASWYVWHRGQSAGYYSFLNQTAAQTNTSNTITFGNNTTYVDPTSTQFTVGSNGNVNGLNNTYVAYIFAHDAGGFGLTGTDNVISCGSFTNAGSTLSVTLGYEPQYLLIKNSTSVGSWAIFDNMRGMVVGSADARLYANTADAEGSSDWVTPTSTGFDFNGASLGTGTYIYIAIRRGPMKVPTDATKVFTPSTFTSNGATNREITSGFVTDTFLGRHQDHYTASSYPGFWFASRLTGNSNMVLGSTDYESILSSATYRAVYTINSGNAFTSNTGYGVGDGYEAKINYGSGYAIVTYGFQRAPKFHDVVTYTGTGASSSVPHNLAAAPEFVIIKSRTSSQNFVVCSNIGASTYNRYLAPGTNTLSVSYASNSDLRLQPDSTNLYLGTESRTNQSGQSFIAYLFSTCPGVSKVGTYTGTGSTQTIACGFTGGARFVIVRRLDSTGIYVWDTARGMVAGSDYSISMTSDSGQSNANYLYTTTGGFQLIGNNYFNNSGISYSYLAIA